MLVSSTPIERFNYSEKQSGMAYFSGRIDNSLVKSEESISIKIKHEDLDVIAQETIRDSSLESEYFATLDSGASDIDIDRTTSPFKELRNIIEVDFNEYFYNFLKREINTSFQNGLFTSATILSRKMIENLVIDILRAKYPPRGQGSLEPYYNKARRRFHDFSILIKNLEEKKEDFILDEEIVSKFISLAKPFRESANSNAHSIITISEESKVNNYKIPEMVGLLLRLKDNLK